MTHLRDGLSIPPRIIRHHYPPLQTSLPIDRVDPRAITGNAAQVGTAEEEGAGEGSYAHYCRGREGEMLNWCRYVGLDRVWRENGLTEPFTAGEDLVLVGIAGLIELELFLGVSDCLV